MGLDFERVVLTLTSLALIDAAYCCTAEAVPVVQSGD